MPRPTNFFLAAAAIFCLAVSPLLRAQAPPGPIQPKRLDADKSAPPPEEKKSRPRHDLWGTWNFNAKKSDDPRKKLQGTRGEGPTWSGYPGSRGGYPGARDPYGSSAIADRLHDLIDPANSLALAHKDAEVDVTDDADRKRALFTDGRKLQKSKDDHYREQAAYWDGPRLVTDEKGPYGMKVTRSFEISWNGQQLYETLAVDLGNIGEGFVMIRYIYDPANQNAEVDTTAKPADAKP